MDRNDLAVEKFCLVRDAIDQTLYPNATPENRELITGWFALHAEYFATHSETMVL